MIIGTGVDIIKVERFEKNNPRFTERVFSVLEQEYLSGKGAETMAGLFAAKEAVAKAMGTGFAGFYPCEIEILHNKKGKPYVKLHGKAEDAVKKLVVGACRGFMPRRLLRLRNLAVAQAPAKAPRVCRPINFQQKSANTRFHFHISISHTATDAIAFAVLELYE